MASIFITLCTNLLRVNNSTVDRVLLSALSTVNFFVSLYNENYKEKFQELIAGLKSIPRDDPSDAVKARTFLLKNLPGNYIYIFQNDGSRTPLYSLYRDGRRPFQSERRRKNRLYLEEFIKNQGYCLPNYLDLRGLSGALVEDIGEIGLFGDEILPPPPGVRRWSLYLIRLRTPERTHYIMSFFIGKIEGLDRTLLKEITEIYERKYLGPADAYLKTVRETYDFDETDLEYLELQREIERVNRPPELKANPRNMKRLRELCETLQARLTSQRESMVRIVHDIRLPLGNFYNDLSRLKTGPTERDGAEKIFARMQNQLTHLDYLTRDLLLLEAGRISSDEETPENESYTLEDLCLEILDNHRRALELKEIRLIRENRDSMSSAATSPDLVLSNRNLRLVRRILYNLISNALRFCHVPGRLYLQIGYSPELCHYLELEDNGPGMDEEILLKLARKNMGRGLGGHGIGLASAAELARRLQGELRLIPPKHGKGTRFLLVLPAQSCYIGSGSTNEHHCTEKYDRQTLGLLREV